MQRWIFAFLVGDIVALFSPILLPLTTLFILFFFVLVLTILVTVKTSSRGKLKRHRIFSAVIAINGFVAGFVYLMCMSNAHFNNNFVLAKAQTFLVHGEVSSVVVKKESNPSVIFSLKVKSIDGQPLESPWLSTVIRVSWYKPNVLLQQGDILTTTVKLAKPHGYQNRFGFDYNQWVFSKGIIATGSVKKIHTHSSSSNLKSTQQTSVNKLIGALKELELKGENTQGILLAVGLGNRSLITSEQFELYNHMGISHLLAISGLHIGIIFLVIKLLLKLVSKGLLTVTQFHLSHRISTILVLVLLWMYIGLIDFPISATRAGLFVSLWALLDLTFSNINKIKLLLSVAFFSLLIDPFSPLNAAWWLTFSAVLGIVLFIQKVPFLKPVSIDSVSIKAAPTKSEDIEEQDQSLNIDPVLKAKLLILFTSLKNKMVYLVKFQVFITVWMMPVVLFWFGGVSMSGVLTNLIAIPIFSLILVPCIFIGTIGALLDISWLTYLLVFADTLLSPLINLFSSYSIFHYWIDLAFGVWAWWLLIICIVLILPAYAFRGKFSSKAISHRNKVLSRRISRRNKGSLVLGILLFLPMALSFYPWQTSSVKQFQPKLKMFVLDVGQGTSILFQQGSSAFIYDLGPIYPSGFNATQAVVQPMLVGLGITDVALIVISHNDSDHIGDINVLGKPEWIAARKRNCKPQMFNWLNVKVEMLWPEEPQFNSFAVKHSSRNKPSENKLSKNDSSCVVKITDKLSNITVLLTGDITSKIERRLLVMHNKSKIDLKADVLISAHHGSKYSSAQKFINTVAPIKVLHSAGVNNRFGFPTKEVIRRFDIFADQALALRQIQPQQAEPEQKELQLMQTSLPLIAQYSTNKQGMLEVTFIQSEEDSTGKNSTNNELIVGGYLNNWQPFWKKQNPFRFTSKIR